MISRGREIKKCPPICLILEVTEAANGVVLWKKVFLLISQKFTAKHLRQRLFFYNVAGVRP